MKRIALVASLLLVGCGDDGNTTQFEGIYEISSWTENPDGCDVQGPSVLPHPFGTTHFYVQNESFFGESFVNVVGCEGIADCQQEAEELFFDLSFFGLLPRGNDEDGWTNDESSCGGGGSIEYPELLMVQDGEGTLALEARIKSLMDPPRDNEDFLDCEAGYAEVASLPCEKLEFIQGTLVEAL